MSTQLGINAQVRSTLTSLNNTSSERTLSATKSRRHRNFQRRQQRSPVHRHSGKEEGECSQRRGSPKAKHAAAHLHGASDAEEPEANEGQDVKFINIESDVTTQPKANGICADDIQSQANETDPLRVFEANCSSSDITCINNLQHFRQLRILDLSCNQITCMENLQELQELRELKLYGNQFQQIENLDCLRELCHLQLQYNAITSVGKGLRKLKKLTILRLDSNRLRHISGPELSGCDLLTSLDISCNAIENISVVNCLPNLTELFARRNNIKRIPDIARCKKLQEVDLSHNAICDLSGLRQLKCLQILHVTDNQLSSMDGLVPIATLEELHMSKNKLCRLCGIQNFYPHLQTLDVTDNRIASLAELTVLAELCELRELFIAGNAFAEQTSDMNLSHTHLKQLLPDLHILDGIHFLKQTARLGTPLMRPMTAASVITTKQVDSQINAMEQQLAEFEKSFSDRFASLEVDLESAPCSRASNVSSPSRNDSRLSSRSDSRLSSRCGKRSRIHDARQFAASNFMSNSRKTDTTDITS